MQLFSLCAPTKLSMPFVLKKTSYRFTFMFSSASQYSIQAENSHCPAQ